MQVTYTHKQKCIYVLFFYRIQLEDGFLKTFLEQTKGLSYVERGERLENAQEIIDTHMESAQEGQTEVLCYFAVENYYCLLSCEL